MSSALMRHYDLTLAFVPLRRERAFERSMLNWRLRMSRRRLKGVARSMLARFEREA